MESILSSIKKLLGIQEEYHYYDADLIIFINATLLTLSQIGVGPEDGYTISSSDNIWDEFVDDKRIADLVKPYVAMKVRLAWDPPSSSYAMESMNKVISEYEWRIRLISDPTEEWFTDCEKDIECVLGLMKGDIDSVCT